MGRWMLNTVAIHEERRQENREIQIVQRPVRCEGKKTATRSSAEKHRTR